MSIIKIFCVGSLFALSISLPALAQSPKGGDEYAPTQRAPQQLTPSQVRKTEAGDYYVNEKMVLHHHRSAALAKCTDGQKFASDSYVACMLREGENP